MTAPMLAVPARPPLQPDDGLYFPAEVAVLLRVTVPTLVKWADAGKLPHTRTPAGTRRYHAGPVNELLRGGPC